MRPARAYLRPDGTLRIVHPAGGNELGEVWRRAVEADPTLRGLTWQDVDADELPPRIFLEPQCGHFHPCRDQWRLAGGRVVRDQSVPNPSGEAAMARCRDQRTAEDITAPLPDRLMALARLARWRS